MTRDEINKQALGVLKQHRRCGAALTVSAGKTKLGLNHFELVFAKMAERHNRDGKGLVVAPTLKIIKGWKDEAKKWNLEWLLEHIDFSTYRSLNKQKTNYDIVYLDECHSLKFSHKIFLSQFNGFILGLTGTPPKRKGSEKYKMVEQFCPIVYEYEMDEAVDQNILNDYRITVHLLELSNEANVKIEIKDKKTGLVSKSWWTSEVKNYLWNTERCENAFGAKDKSWRGIMRMKAMHTYPTKEEYAKRLLDESNEKCILFANEKKQADKLCSHSYHSSNKNSEKNMELFEKGEITKLSCVDQLSEGANISGLKEIIIMHSYSNNRKAAQKIGRVMRLNPDETAHIHILCFKDTVDVTWVQNALADLNQDKITWYDPDVF